MLQKLCILLLGYLGYRLYKKVMKIDDRVTDIEYQNHIESPIVEERASE